MTIRILLADLAEARFYDVDVVSGTLRCVSVMSCPAAHLHDRDLKSDRPGRVYDHAAGHAQQRGAVPEPICLPEGACFMRAIRRCRGSLAAT